MSESTQSAGHGDSCPAVLTPRQTEVVELAASGLSAKKIAARLTISKQTVDGHFKAARRRVGAKNMAELIALTAQSLCSEITDSPDD